MEAPPPARRRSRSPSERDERADDGRPPAKLARRPGELPGDAAAAGAAAAGDAAPQPTPPPARHRRLERMLPPEPDGDAPPHIVARFTSFLRETIKGHNFTAILKSKRDFNNPYYLEEVARAFGIDDISSQYPPHLWDPHGFQPADFYDALALAQAKAEEERAAGAGLRTAVPFTSAGPQAVGLLAPGAPGGGGGLLLSAGQLSAAAATAAAAAATHARSAVASSAAASAAAVAAAAATAGAVARAHPPPAAAVATAPPARAVPATAAHAAALAAALAAAREAAAAAAASRGAAAAEAPAPGAPNLVAAPAPRVSRWG